MKFAQTFSDIFVKCEIEYLKILYYIKFPVLETDRNKLE